MESCILTEIWRAHTGFPSLQSQLRPSSAVPAMSNPLASLDDDYDDDDPQSGGGASESDDDDRDQPAAPQEQQPAAGGGGDEWDEAEWSDDDDGGDQADEGINRWASTSDARPRASDRSHLHSRFRLRRRG